ncbi:MAG: hypothetical protein RR843_05650, partial [Clostridia bacterium]
MENQQKRCLYCFAPLNAHGACPACHKDPLAPTPAGHLVPGTLIRGRFEMGRALGQDADGIVYTAYDIKSGQVLRIRELFPKGAVERMADGTVVPLAGNEAAFAQALNRMRSSADTGDSARKRLFFEACGTGYLAQRRAATAAGTPAAPEDAAPARKLTKQAMIVIAVVIVIVLAALIGIISAMRGAVDN